MKFKTRMLLVALLVLIMFILHNSFFLWDLDSSFPLLFGFMPFAYFYYVVYAVLSILVILLVIKLVWPDPPHELFDPVNTEEMEES